jgi:hypothetical protein
MSIIDSFGGFVSRDAQRKLRDDLARLEALIESETA